MPALQCQECGKALLQSDPNRSKDTNCVCSDCGRKVYARETVEANVKCPKCNATNKTSVTI